MRRFLTPEYFKDTNNVIVRNSEQHHYADFVRWSTDLYDNISYGNTEDVLKIIERRGLLPVTLNTHTVDAPQDAWQRIHDPRKLIDQLIGWYGRDDQHPTTTSRAHLIPQLEWMKHLLELFYEGESIENCLEMHRARQKLLFPEEYAHREQMQKEREARREAHRRLKEQRA